MLVYQVSRFRLAIHNLVNVGSVNSLLHNISTALIDSHWAFEGIARTAGLQVEVKGSLRYAALTSWHAKYCIG
jgi:hypothetical protein